MSLDGKVAIVTGSGRGLGLAYAQELARQGASVVVNDVDAQTAADAVATIEAAGGQAVAVVAPVGPTETAKQLVAHSGRHLRSPRHPRHQRRRAARHRAVEDERRRLRHRHRRAPARHVHLRARGRHLHAREETARPHHLHRLADRPARQLRPDQLRRRQGRHRRHGAHLGARAQAGRHHRQRRDPRRRDRDDRDRALLRGRGRGGRRRASRCPAFFRHDLGFGTSDDVAGLIAYLASDAAAGVTGQAIGIGGDRLQVWSHPEPVRDRVPRGRLDLRGARGATSPASFGAAASRWARSSFLPRCTAGARPRPNGSIRARR